MANPQVQAKAQEKRVEDLENQQDECIVVCEFKIEGMTCVNCSSAIEKGLKLAFENKGLV